MVPLNQGCRGVLGVWVCGEFLELGVEGMGKKEAPQHGIIPTT